MVTKSSSAVVVHAGEHLFKVIGHSTITGKILLTSDTFRVADHDWAIMYYPNGDARVVNDQFSSIFLKLMTAGEEEVRAYYSFCLQDPAAPATGEKHKYKTGPKKFSSTDWGWGRSKFVSKADLSGCLDDGCLVIKCTIEVPRLMDDQQEGDENDGVIVPPADLSKDLANLLDSGLILSKADLTIKIGWFKRFKVHACVLAARSPVFRAQLCGAMMESRESSIRIEDVDAKVFEILLHYVYNDRLPESMDETTEETTNMAQHLLIAADRYAMERLKLMCESRLSKALDINTVGFTLDLAEQYHCQQLKDCCLRYMTRNSKRLQEIINSEGFAQLKRNHPQAAFDILGQVIALLAT
ncbi:BTB/POZ and MATH domain-containing protein 1-like [Triticum urartu]|uniref:BTB/POZ and MATH domain-containing protein 1-like n=1 Tax=Triticum urartu TaxID=4572 RepID=UPI002042DCC7|nr:BTB/POZ and MATH domain-containing protein 1-like [Triticum urartu]